MGTKTKTLITWPSLIFFGIIIEKGPSTKTENLWVEEKAYWLGRIQVWVPVLARLPKSRARRP